MKKAVCIVAIFLLVFSVVAVSLVACDRKSANVRRGLNAMNDGDYDRALRLYTFAIENGDADNEDKQIYEILRAYTDAQRSLKSESFSDGLDILSNCSYDYSSLSISTDMERLYNQLSDGKYADERIKTLGEIISSGNLDRAAEMIGEINQLSLTSNQQSRLDALGRQVSEKLSAQNPDNFFVYYVNRPSGGSVPMYYEASEDSEIIHRIPSGEPIQAQNLAENGFIAIIYNGENGYVLSSDIVADAPREPYDDDKDDDDDDKDKDDDEKTQVPVEAISADDSLFAIVAVNLREEPNLDCKVIDTIPADAEVTYLGEMERGYYKVRYDGTVGYAYSDYLKANK